MYHYCTTIYIVLCNGVPGTYPGTQQGRMIFARCGVGIVLSAGLAGLRREIAGCLLLDDIQGGSKGAPDPRQ